nr:RecName: Full=Glucose-1-phosphate adenylyltransferase small subunit; AltName: Full=ADP-glucose pyrophosphorylase; AltName: Full=ADP-glucose synthase; AltName: Full=AGPase B; AltName: Full=Alpha-D-glucose-1-phosphate adenyl transferase [Spinacia oleracea]
VSDSQNSQDGLDPE